LLSFPQGICICLFKLTCRVVHPFALFAKGWGALWIADEKPTYRY
jgi:hypothetical protein